MATAENASKATSKTVFSLQLVLFVDDTALGLRVVNVYILREKAGHMLDLSCCKKPAIVEALVIP